MRISTPLLVLLLGICFPINSVLAISVTLDGTKTWLRTQVGLGSGPESVFENVFPATLPYSYSSTVDNGTSSAASDYDLSNADFSITLDHSRAAMNARALSRGQIFFSVDQDVDYTASGSYSAVDPEGRRIYYEAFLFDHTLLSSAFFSRQVSRSTLNESFNLGGSAGDFENQSSGTLTGTILSGHEYSFQYQVWVDAYPTASPSGATASGNLSLTFVPEPTTGLLMGMGLVLWLAVDARRQRRRS